MKNYFCQHEILLISVEVQFGLVSFQMAKKDTSHSRGGRGYYALEFFSIVLPPSAD